MTNASKISSFSMIFLSALVLVFGAFATSAYAQEDNIGYLDLGSSGGDYISAPDYSGDYVSAPDYSGDYVSAPDYAGDYISAPESNYAGDYISAPDNGTEYGTDEFGTDTFGTDTYGTNMTYQDGLTYSYTPSFSAPTSYGGYTSYAAPSYSYPTAPIVFNAPSYVAPKYVPTPTPAPKPTPVVTTTPTVTTITNTNTNVNNNNNNININNTPVTVTPIQAAPVQPIIQYVQPQPQPQPQPIYYSHPSCTISITNYNGNSYGPNAYSQLATITWSSQNAMNGYISPNVGSVSGYGSMQVYPTNGQIYTMTVYGQGGSATCSTQPFYTYVTPIVTNPAPYVSLSQIPYTGFDFGMLGNSIYWLSLVLFAGAAAYLVLYFNGGALAILGGNRSRKQTIAMPKITVSKAPAKVVAAEKVAAPVVSPVQISSTNARTAQDTMRVTHSKGGEMPRISISRG